MTGISNPKPCPSSQKETQVSIVIAGRNSERWLEEAIESALKQTVKCEVVYVDDCSNDSSVEIANRYIPKGLRVIVSGTHLGVCSARNRGANSTTAPYIIFMDSDDRLPSEFVQRTLTDLHEAQLSMEGRSRVAFVYPSTKCFGASTTLWNNLHWSKYDKWKQNQVSTTSMWDRTIFNGAGGWHDLPTMWDYDLALRCSKLGTPVAGRAILDYRIHDESQSAVLDERFNSVEFRELIRRKNASLGIGCLVGGRVPSFFPKWISRLACSVRYMQNYYPDKKVKLFLLLHTKAQPHLRMYQEESKKYSSTLDIEFGFINDVVSYETEYARRQSVCRLLATACQKIQDTLSTDIVWLVEDDITPPLRGCYDLFIQLTATADIPTAVSGCYWNRHPEMLGKVLGGWIRVDKNTGKKYHYEPSVSFRELDVVDFCGTGCLMYWRDRPSTPKKWKPLTTINEPGATAHDWAWSEEVKELGGHILMCGNVDCEHWIDEKEWV